MEWNRKYRYLLFLLLLLPVAPILLCRSASLPKGQASSSVILRAPSSLVFHRPSLGVEGGASKHDDIVTVNITRYWTCCGLWDHWSSPGLGRVPPHSVSQCPLLLWGRVPVWRGILRCSQASQETLSFQWVLSLPLGLLLLRQVPNTSLDPDAIWNRCLSSLSKSS